MGSIEAVKRSSPYIIVSLIIVVALGLLIIETHALLKILGLTGYELYFITAEMLGLGFVSVEFFSKGIYLYSLRVVGEASAKGIRVIVRIIGYGILLSMLASVFNANPAAALTLGSFIGLVVGFASQQVMGNAIAGMFLAFSRPFRIGDKVKIVGVEGVVVNINVMYIVIDAGSKKVLIPSSKIVGNIIEVYKQQGSE